MSHGGIERGTILGERGGDEAVAREAQRGLEIRVQGGDLRGSTERRASAGNELRRMERELRMTTRIGEYAGQDRQQLCPVRTVRVEPVRGLAHVVQDPARRAGGFGPRWPNVKRATGAARAEGVR